MASRGGVMVTGTNGADYEHREKIAAQYQIRWVLELFLRVFGCSAVDSDPREARMWHTTFHQVPSNYF